MREAEIERRVCEQAKALDISTLKLGGPHNRGKADRIFMRHGKTVFVELKAPGGRPTELQLRFLKERVADGFAADWFSSIPEAVKFLKEHLL